MSDGIEQCTAEDGSWGSEVRCQEIAGHEGVHRASRSGFQRRWPNPKPQNPTVEITLADLKVLAQTGPLTPGEAAARVGALRRAQKLISGS